ncbi:MAG: hypothetical protein O7H40_11770 [Gammaproteobacteria bacterium]|nr:hypothetical protein [Gammaproteobacteria bacterium]
MTEISRALSDYELIEMLNAYLNASGDHFMNFISVLFAFLVVIYLVGDKLSKPMLGIIVGLYSIFSILPFGAVYTDTLWYAAIANELALRG